MRKSKNLVYNRFLKMKFYSLAMAESHDFDENLIGKTHQFFPGSFVTIFGTSSLVCVSV